MLENIISGLVLTAITSLAFLAYKHPHGFNRICWPIIGSVAVTCGIIFSFKTGQVVGFASATIGYMKLNSQTNLSEPKPPRFELWWAAIPIAFKVYVLSLSFIPQLLSTPKNNTAKQKPKNEMLDTNPKP